jgi:hypothetical protein
VKITTQKELEDLKIKTLNELFDLIKSGDLDELDDWSNFPIFGGKEPEDTAEIWSWDETRLIVGICSQSMEIISREEQQK